MNGLQEMIICGRWRPKTAMGFKCGGIWVIHTEE